MSESTILSESPSVAEPVKKPKWYWRVFNVFGFLLTLWLFVGIRGLLLQDIPLLLFVLFFAVLMFLPIARWVGLPPRSYRGGCLHALWVITVVVFIYLSLFFIIPPFAISPETTYLTEPRAKDYYGIDYQAAILQELDPGVPPENNGFRPLIETFGRTLYDAKLAEKLEGKHWNQLCQYLDLDPELEPKSTFTDFRTYIKTLPPDEQDLVEKTLFEDLFPMPDKMVPILRRWLDENEPALELFAEAAQKPALFLPPLFDTANFVPETLQSNEILIRRMIQGIYYRIAYYLENNEIEKAWNDVLTIYRLVKHQRRAVWNISSLRTNHSILVNGNLAAAAVIINSDWSADEIRRRVDEILPFQEPFDDVEIKKVLRNERLQVLDFCQNMLVDRDALANPKDFSHWLQFKSLQTVFRRGYMMAAINRQCNEREQRFFRGLPEPARQEIHFRGMIMDLVWYGKYVGIPTMIGRLTGEMFVFSTKQLQPSLLGRQTHCSLFQLECALESYRRDHTGEFPDKLDDLRERYLAEIPLDPFSGKPFRYVVKPATDDEPANVLLYSVGPNGIDEEGRDGKEEPKGDDICRRFVKE